MTLSTAVMLISLGLLYSTLFQLEIRDYLPWLAVDDRSWLYRPFCRSLFLVEGKTGLTSLLGAQLLSRLRNL